MPVQRQACPVNLCDETECKKKQNKTTQNRFEFPLVSFFPALLLATKIKVIIVCMR